MTYRCAVLDDFQNIALQMADWSKIRPAVEITVFDQPLGRDGQLCRALQGFAIICLMRERTAFPSVVIDALPDLRLIVTTGGRNPSIDIKAAADRNVTVCGTDALAHPTVELTYGLMLELARHAGLESARLKAGAAWQSTVGIDLFGKTLGVLGLGRLGARVADIGRAFGMRVVAWSPNLTAEKCRDAGADYVSKEDLLRLSDFLSIHLQLSARTKGILGAAELDLMKPTAYLINTSRGSLVDEAALVAALRARRIAGAGLDVFHVEPLPLNHPLRSLPNTVLTPHLGYVTTDNYRTYYGGTVDAIRAWLDGKPIHVMTPS